ncbi:MAG TPA: FHA domain-containing protein [Kofleriaceae bacterium]|nr:FHA domain-containing protein [Kofleriaceae bacterium]
MSTTPTTTDQRRGWRIVDPVFQLRALETGEIYELPDPRAVWKSTLGTGASSQMRLRDPSGRASRRHGYIEWDGERWTMHDFESKNGIWVDGIRRRSAELAPGLAVGVGGLTLLAESADLLQLRAVVAWLIGYAAAQEHEVDRALRGLRDAALLRASLVLCGEGDLVPLIQRLHRETLGADRPFIACEPTDRALELLSQAGDGTLCVSAADPPEDFADAVHQLLTTPAATRLVLWASDARDASPLGAALGPTVWIELPALATRKDELPRILREAAAAAATDFGQPFAPLREGDLERLTIEPFDGLADVHDAARRVVAFRTFGVTAGAAKLGINHGALSRWIRRRKLT